MPFVMTTLLGIGPRPARSWLDSLFSAAYAQELASGGTGCDTAHRRLVFIMSLQASAVRSTAHMVSALHREAPHCSIPPWRRRRPGALAGHRAR